MAEARSSLHRGQLGMQSNEYRDFRVSRHALFRAFNMLSLIFQDVLHVRSLSWIRSEAFLTDELGRLGHGVLAARLVSDARPAEFVLSSCCMEAFPYISQGRGS